MATCTLTRVGAFDQVRLIAVKGRLRFIDVLQSESVDSRMAISPRMAPVDTKERQSHSWLSPAEGPREQDPFQRTLLARGSSPQTSEVW